MPPIPRERERERERERDKRCKSIVARTFEPTDSALVALDSLGLETKIALIKSRNAQSYTQDGPPLYAIITSAKRITNGDAID